MSINKVNHNVVSPHTAKVIPKDSDSYGDKWNASTSTGAVWIDCNGWTDKKISIEGDPAAGSASLSLVLDVSPKHAYELNELTKAGGAGVTTDDYEAITVNASALTVATLTSYDAEDLDDLQRPFRSCRLKVTNNEASNACTVTTWIEGWS